MKCFIQNLISELTQVIIVSLSAVSIIVLICYLLGTLCFIPLNINFNINVSFDCRFSFLIETTDFHDIKVIKSCIGHKMSDPAGYLAISGKFCLSV